MNIYERIETLYNEPKSKGFITHLLRSFFPLGKGNELFTRPEGVKTIKCCITGVELCSKEEKINYAFQNRETITSNMIEQMKSSFKEDDHIPSEDVKQLEITLGDMHVAVSSEKSDKYLSTEAYKELYNFYATQILRGDKNIVWIAKNEMTKQKISSLENNGMSFTPREKKVVHKAVENSGGMSLGDMEILKNLKNKFKD